MSLFKRRERRIPELNTSSLPDMIFTVLFFFMIVTTMREVEMKVKYTTPQGSQTERLAKKSTISHIYIGRAEASSGGEKDGGMRIQLNDKLADVDDIADYIAAERSRMAPEDLKNMKVSICADKSVPMGLISDVKQALRNSYALNIVYSGEQDDAE